MDFFDAVHSRASVRAFKDRPLTEAEWDSLLRAAMAAPSAVNMQPWDLVVIEDRPTLEKLASVLPYAKMTAGAGGAVLVCGTPGRAFMGLEAFAVIDPALATQNLLLAATALGLGAVYTAVYPDPARMAAVRSLLGIPEAVIPLALVPVGEPVDPAQPKDKYRPELVHRGRW